MYEFKREVGDIRASQQLAQKIEKKKKKDVFQGVLFG